MPHQRRSAGVARAGGAHGDAAGGRPRTLNVRVARLYDACCCRMESRPSSTACRCPPCENPPRARGTRRGGFRASATTQTYGTSAALVCAGLGFLTGDRNSNRGGSTIRRHRAECGIEYGLGEQATERARDASPLPLTDSRLVEMHHHCFVRPHQRHVGSRRARFSASRRVYDRHRAARTGHPVLA